ELAGGAVDQPRPPLWQSHNGAPHPSPEPSALRAFGSDPIAGRWGPVDQRHRCAMPGLRLGRAPAIFSRSLSLLARAFARAGRAPRPSLRVRSTLALLRSEL